MEPTSPPAPPPMGKPPKRRRRWPWILLLGFFGVLLLLAGGVWLFIHSSAGGALIRDKALTAANGALKGKLEAEKVELSGTRVILENVKLYTPEGELVAELKRLEADADVWALTRGTLVVRDAKIQGLRAYLKNGDDGLNLLRAVEAKNPTPKTDTGQSKLTLELKKVSIEDSYADYQQGTQRYTLDALAGDVVLSLKTPPLTMNGNVKLRAKASLQTDTAQEGLTAAPLNVDAKFGGQPGDPLLSTVVTLDDTRVDGELTLQSLQLKLKSLDATPKVVRALVPALKLKVPVHAEGTASMKSADLALKAGEANIKVTGQFDPGEARVDAFSLETSQLDLDQLLEGTRPSKLYAKLNGSLTDSKPASLTGAVKGEVRWDDDDTNQPPLARAELDVTADHGTFDAKQLDVFVPGATLDARGKGTQHDVELTGELIIKDLARVMQAVSELTGNDAPPLSGNGRLSLRAKGPLLKPAVSAKGTLPTFKSGDLSLTGLTLDAHLADVTRPLEADGAVHADRLQSGETVLEDLGARVQTHGRLLEVQLDTKGFTTLAVSLAGELDASNDGLRIDKLVARWPEAEWALEKPTHLRFAKDDLALDPLALRARDQRLVAQGSLKKSRIDAKAVLENFDLSRLPAALLPKPLRVAGQVQADLTAKGTLKSPELDAVVKLAHVEVKRERVKDAPPISLQDLTATLNAHLSKQRLTADGNIGSPLVNLQLTANIPINGIAKRSADDAEAHLTMLGLDVAKLSEAIGTDLPALGIVEAQVDLTGSFGAPQLKLKVAAPRGVQLLRPAAPMEAGDTEALARPDSGVTLEALTDGGPAPNPHAPAPIVSSNTRDGGALSNQPITGRDIVLGTPTVLSARDGGDDLLFGRPPPIPLQSVVLEVNNANDAGTLVAVLDVEAFEGKTHAELGTPLTVLGLLDRPPTKESVTQLPLTIDAKVEGVQLEGLRNLRLLPRRMQGQLQLELHARGTLGAPTLDATLDVDNYVTGQLKPTALHATLKSDREALKATVLAQRTGKVKILSLDATVGAPLEQLAQLTCTPDTPLRVELEVGPLALSELLEKKPDDASTPPSGNLQAYAQLKGTLRDPKAEVRGHVDNLALGKTPLGHGKVTVDYQNALTTLGATFGPTRDATDGIFRARGQLKLDLALPALQKGLSPMDAPFNATVQARQFDLGFLTGMNATVRTVKGQLDADFKLDGTPSDPRFLGKAELKNGRVAMMGFGDYRQIHLALDASNDEFKLSELYTEAGGGWAKFNATGKRAQSGSWTFEGGGESKSFPLIVDDQLAAILGIRTTFEGHLDDRLLEVSKLSIPEARVELPDVKTKDLQSLERPKDILLVRNGVPVNKPKPKPNAGQAQAEAPAVRVIRVFIDAPRNLWVKSSDLNIELGLSERFRFEMADQPLMYGEAQVIRGRIDVIGRRFDLQKDSQVRFAGPAKTPYLNLTALHNNEREGVAVTVAVTGRGKDFNLKMTSTPPLSDSEIFTLLTTGRRNLKRGGGSSTISGEQAASVIGSLAATQLKNIVAKKLPLDVLTVDTGDSGLRSARVEAGTYLSDQVYVGYQLQVGADRRKGENVNAGRIEYQISKYWGVEGTAGDAPAASAELVWSRDY